MRTTKRNVIFLDHMEGVCIQHMGATVTVQASTPNCLQVGVSSGQMMSGLIRKDRDDRREYVFADEDDLREEIPGPVEFIVFSHELIVDGGKFDDDQLKYLKSIGLRIND